MVNKNEYLVLKHLSQNARASDCSIAEKIGITTQAVGKIRRKLEEQKVILDYRVDVRPDILKLNVLTLAALHIPVELIDTPELKKEFVNNAHVLNCLRSLESHINLVVVMGFTTLEDSNMYFLDLEQRFPGVTVVNLQPSSLDLVWKATNKDLYNHLLDKHIKPTD